MVCSPVGDCMVNCINCAHTRCKGDDMLNKVRCTNASRRRLANLALIMPATWGTSLISCKIILAGTITKRDGNKAITVSCVGS